MIQTGICWYKTAQNSTDELPFDFTTRLTIDSGTAIWCPQGPHRPLPCHSEQRCTAAIAPVSALCQIEQMPWEPERPVKCLQVSQELKRSTRSSPSANTQREGQERA